MFNRILLLSIRNRYLVLSLSVVAAVIGMLSYRKLIIDAVPDITNIQVQINSVASGYSPLEAEQRITMPVELLLSGIPNLDYTRSVSRYGLSQVTAVFKDGTDIYFARQMISQKLQEAGESLPDGIHPAMGPIATGLGEIFMFTVENQENVQEPRTLEQLREIQDWLVKPQLRTVSGVVEINSIGGAAKQIIVTPILEKLRSYEMTLDDLALAIAQNNANVGAGFVEQNGEQYLLRVPAQLNDYRELENIVVGVHEGTPIRLSQLAEVQIGSELRAGAATENGREVVLGTVFMLMGENGRDVSERVAARLTEIAKSLPEGVLVKPVYNRSNLVNSAISTVKKNLFEGALLVIVILFAALGNIRAALITACVIPLSMLITIFGMAQAKVSANLMSLGALDFGLIVDGAVILVENCIRRFGEAQNRLGRQLNKEERLELVFEASSEVRQATMFGELIIMVVYIPILMLTGIEGKLYQPMAITVLMALAAAFVFSLTFVPAAVAVLLTGKVKTHSSWVDALQNMYRSFLQSILQIRVLVISTAVILFLGSLIVFSRLGSEFMPSLDEGDIALHALRIPGTSLTQAIKMQHDIENVVKTIPEVSHAFAKIGTAEIANDPMPPSVADGFVMLKPRSEWENPAKSKQEIVDQIESLLKKVPGNNYEFTQPIQMRFNELIAGARSDIVVKLFGDDAAILSEEAEKIRIVLAKIKGVSDLKVEQTTGLPTVTINPNRAKMARFGISASQIQDIVRVAYAGQEVSRYYQGDRNFPIVLRLSETERGSIDSIANLSIPLPISHNQHQHSIQTERTELKSEADQRSYLLLKDLADIYVTEGPNQISRENAKRRIIVTANVRNRDLGSFVIEAQKLVASEYKLPANYWLSWGGQYENLISAKNKLMILVPLVLLGVFGLIYFTFQSVRYSLLVFSAIPFALSGGILALWLRGMPFSISAAVGFIALSGVSVLNGLVLISFIRKLIEDQKGLIDSIIEGSVSRLRPVLMTALVASLGFVPMALSEGIGSEVQKPLATVVIGGIISSTILTLIVLPVLCSFLHSRPVKSKDSNELPKFNYNKSK